jgi:hypothetical protein
MTEEITKTKLCYIEDINKVQLLLHKRNLNTEEFDYLYECSLEHLDTILENLQLTQQLIAQFTKDITGK